MKKVRTILTSFCLSALCRSFSYASEENVYQGTMASEVLLKWIFENVIAYAGWVMSIIGFGMMIFAYKSDSPEQRNKAVLFTIAGIACILSPKIATTIGII